MNYYWADTHFHHANIIHYCARPFNSAGHMDAVMSANFKAIEPLAGHVYHLGDFSFRPKASAPVPVDPHKHTLIAGNHDSLKTEVVPEECASRFATIVGRSGTWRTNTMIVTDTLNGRPVRLLLSHEAQQDLNGCDYNLHGHHHNNMLRNSDRYLTGPIDWRWLYDSHVHFNAGVELQGYIPRTLEAIVASYQGLTLRERLQGTSVSE